MDDDGHEDEDQPWSPSWVARVSQSAIVSNGRYVRLDHASEWLRPAINVIILEHDAEGDGDLEEQDQENHKEYLKLIERSLKDFDEFCRAFEHQQEIDQL